MKNRFFQRSIILCLSLLLRFHSMECDVGNYMGYEMLFDKDFVFDYSKKNLTFNTWYYNSDLYHDSNSKYRNTESWVNFLERAYDQQDIMEFIYRYDLKSNRFEDELLALRNKRKRAIRTPQKEVDFVRFMRYALNVEEFLKTYEPNPWSDEPVNIVSSDFTPLMNKATIQIEANSNQFIRERYAYQLLKLLRYSEQYDLFISTFKKYFENKSSMISYWALEHYAGVLMERGELAESNYHFARVYVNSPEKRSSSYLSMKLGSPSRFMESLNFCKNEDEKIALYYIRAMQTKKLVLEDLQYITKKSGNQEYARVIMSHEINKLEKILLFRSDSPGDSGYLSERTKTQRLLKLQVPNYIKDLIQLNNEMLALDQEDYFWHLSLSYLYYLNGQHEECSKILNLVKSNAADIQKQHDIIYIINYLELNPNLSVEDENMIGKLLFSINDNKSSYPFVHAEKGKRYYDYEDEFNTTNQFIFSKLTERFKNNNNAFMKLIFSGKSLSVNLRVEYDISASDVDKIIEDMRRTQETELSTFAATYYFQEPYYYFDEPENRKARLNFNDCEMYLKELKATILMSDPSTVPKALKIYEELPSEHLDHFVYGSPFEFSAKQPDFENHDMIANALPKLTRIEFARNLNRLLQAPMTSENALKIGLAYYNSSYYGLQWKLLTYFRYYSEPTGKTDMSNCEKYLRDALALGGLDREKQAQVYFMLARCEQNRYTKINGLIPGNYSWSSGFKEYIIQMNESGNMSYLKRLRSGYSDTKAYREIVRECKYLAYYLN